MAKLELGRPLPRRHVLRGGLAGFAAAIAAPIMGCGDDDGMPDVDGGTGTDAGMDIDARPPSDIGAPDGGPSVFPPREIPDPPALISRIAELGPLGEPDANGVRLPAGFTSRVVAVSGVAVEGSEYVWHRAPDGGAVYGTEDGGWIYSCNSEFPIRGGVGSLRFDSDGNLVSAYPTLEGTDINCAGGQTPWHTWLSCEEFDEGRVYETDPWGEHDPIVRPALGVFKHEAVAVDPVAGHLYLTEDTGDGRFYRYVPDGMNVHGFPDLDHGTLEVATVDGEGNVTWTAIPDPEFRDGTPTRLQVPTSTVFRGGEGIWWHDGVIYFTTKGDTRVWAYEIDAAQISVIYDGEAIAEPPLTGVDNLTVSCCGDVLVAEDGGSMQIVAILPSGELHPMMQIVGQDHSEVTGPAFDPSGTRLYFNSQRGGDERRGLTYEITGPFHAPA